MKIWLRLVYADGDAALQRQNQSPEKEIQHSLEILISLIARRWVMPQTQWRPLRNVVGLCLMIVLAGHTVAQLGVFFNSDYL